MNVSPECTALAEILKISPSCLRSCSATETPSYVDDSTPKGCLIAHTTLTIIEAQLVSSHFKTPLFKIFTHFHPSKETRSTEDDLWSELLTAFLLHDLGKLTTEYLERTSTAKPPMRHHQVSAVIAKKALEKMLDSYNALEVAYAVLFHHEALDWKAVENSIFLFSYLSKAMSSSRTPILFNVDAKRLTSFEKNLQQLLHQLHNQQILTKHQLQTLSQALAYSMEEMLSNQKTVMYPGEILEARKTRDPRYTAPALALYRLLYLADNRAASARKHYWLHALKQVNWNQPENTAKQLLQALTRRRYYIGLSAIPETAARGKTL